jgi:uncharacterized protein YdeI (YjbR/CyaY-like superfamily)
VRVGHLSKLMSKKVFETLDVRNRRHWRQWLERHHRSDAAVWLVFHKRRTGTPCLGYEDAVEEAICFGWVDSLIKRLDDDRYARKFTPRTPDSRWSTINRRRYADLEARGLLTDAGRARPPTDRSGDGPRPSLTRLPAYIEQALKAHPSAWQHFERLAPSYRAAYVAWIDSAKREATKDKRLSEAVRLLAAGEKLGMK